MAKRVKLSKQARRRAESLNLMISVNPCIRDEVEYCGAWDAMVYVSGSVRKYAHGDLSEVTEEIGDAVAGALIDFAAEPGNA